MILNFFSILSIIVKISIRIYYFKSGTNPCNQWLLFFSFKYYFSN